MLFHSLRPLFGVAACLGAVAVTRASDALPPQPRFDLAKPVAQALTQVDEDGSVWARGPSWKAHFERGAVEFRALSTRREPPARAQFRLVSASVGSRELDLDREAPPILEGERVTYDRGGWLETYDLMSEGIEQSFVFLSLPEGGDLSIHIALETALCARAEASGLVLDRDERLGLRYGALHVVDAAGRRLSRASVLEGSEIVLRVPRAFLATASFPLVVDPLITTLAIDGGADVCTEPDVAFDATTSRWLVVYERAAGNEGDIISRRYDLNGVLLEELAVDISGDDTIEPAVANNNTANQFLIVWQKGTSALSLFQKIRARTRNAGSTVQGSIFNVTTVSANEERPEVGGSPNSGDDKYFVVWKTSVGFPIPDLGDVRGRSVSTAGVLGSIVDIDTRIGVQQTPAITKSCGPAGIWGIAYHFLPAIGAESPVLLAFVSKSGSLLATELEADTSGNHRVAEAPPSIAGDGRVFGVTWTELDASDRGSVIGSFVAFQNGLLSPLAGTINLSAVEPGVVGALSRKSGAIETDGLRFSYAYREQRPNNSDFDIFAATVDPITAAFAEGHVSLGASIFQDDEIALASTFGSNSPISSRCLAVWSRQPAAENFDVVGALYAQP